jgi:hypothetical protein
VHETEVVQIGHGGGQGGADPSEDFQAFDSGLTECLSSDPSQHERCRGVATGGPDQLHDPGVGRGRQDRCFAAELIALSRGGALFPKRVAVI